MLDKKTINLLKIINQQIKDDSYKVIEKSDFLSRNKKGQNWDEKTLAADMDYLQKNNYIDIKYSDAEVYCLAVKQKARNVHDNTYLEITQFKRWQKKFWLYVVLSGITSFLGTLAALLVFLRG